MDGAPPGHYGQLVGTRGQRLQMKSPVRAGSGVCVLPIPRQFHLGVGDRSPSRAMQKAAPFRLGFLLRVQAQAEEERSRKYKKVKGLYTTRSMEENKGPANERSIFH